MPMDERYETHSLTWADLNRLARRHWKLVLVVFVSGVLGTYLTLQLFFTSQYETKTMLLVKVGRENAEMPSTILNGQILNQGVRVADINSEVQLLSSRLLVEQVVDDMGPDAFKPVLPKPASVLGYPRYAVKLVARWAKTQYQEFLILAGIKRRLTSREKAVVGVAEAVTAEPMKESDVLQLKVRLPSAALSTEVSDRILRYYMAERAAARRVSSSNDLFSSELDEQRARLKDLAQQREQVRRNWNVSSAEQQRGLLLQELNSMHQQITSNNGEIAQLRQQQSVMRDKLQSVPDMLPKERVESRNPALQSIKERLTALQIDRAKLSNSYLPDSEMMRRMNQEIAQLQASLDREAPTVPQSSTAESNPVLREFKSGIEEAAVRMSGLTRRNEELSASSQRIRADLDRVNRGGDAYESLNREYRVAESSFTEYAKKQEDAVISRALDQKGLPNVVVMGGSETPIEPVYPRQLFILGFALPISLILGIAIAALVEALDDRVWDERSLSGIEGVPVLGTLHFDRSAGIAGAGVHAG